MRKRPLCLVCLLMVLGIWLLQATGVPLGAPVFSPELEQAAQKEEKIQIVGKIQTYEKKKTTAGYLVKVDKIAGKEVIEKGVCVYVNSSNQELPLEATAAFYGKIKKPEQPQNPGQFDSKSYYWRKGARVVLQAEKEILLEVPGVSGKEIIRKMRASSEKRIEKMLPEKEAGVLKAMLLGDRSEVDEETYQAYQRGGMLHILSVSGMHLLLLGTMVQSILRRCWIPRVPASILSAGIMAGYSLFAGSGTAAVRAEIMFAILMGAQAAGRSYDAASALALAIILMLAGHPAYLKESGFWLSCCAVAGVCGVYPVLFCKKEKQERKKRKMRFRIVQKIWDTEVETGKVYLSIQLVLVPLQAWCFFELPLFGILPSLVIGPLFSIILFLGAAGVLIGNVSLLAGKYLLLPASWAIRIYGRIADLTAKIPGSVWICGQPEKWQMAVYGGMLLLFLVEIWRENRKKNNKEKAEQNMRRFRKKILWMAAAFLILFWRSEPACSITALDVGQGDCIAVRSKKICLLNDGGSSSVKNPGKYRILPWLKQQGIGTVEAVILSHPDEDHGNGLLELLAMAGEGKTTVKIRRLLLPWWMKGSKEEIPWRKAAQKAEIMVQYLEKGDQLKYGKMHLEVLHPDKKTRQKEYLQEKNAGSIVLSLRYQKFSALLTGDLEGEGEELLAKETAHADVLKVAHHGSRNSTGETFLAQISPKISLISCGKKNRYGHPHPELLERLEKSKSQIYCTPESGAITVWLRQNTVYVKTFRKMEQTERKYADGGKTKGFYR